MIQYDNWIFEPNVGYIKTASSRDYDIRFDVIVSYDNDKWSPIFYDKQMWLLYSKYNKEYYIDGGPDDGEAVTAFMDQFLQKYNKLLVFM